MSGGLKQTYESDFFEFSFGAAGMRGGSGRNDQYHVDGECDGGARRIGRYDHRHGKLYRRYRERHTIGDRPPLGPSTDPATTTFTITGLTGGNLTGNISVSQSILTGGATSSASVTVTVTNGTGTYAGATGTFKLTGSVTGDH